MFRTTLKNLAAHKLRLLTTSLAVLLGVAFMSGTLVLTDTIGKTFDGLLAELNEGTDVHVRSDVTTSSDQMGEQRARLDASLVDTIAGVDGVQAAEGSIEGYAQLVDHADDRLGQGPRWGQHGDLLAQGEVADVGAAPVDDDLTGSRRGAPVHHLGGVEVRVEEPVGADRRRAHLGVAHGSPWWSTIWA